MRRPDLTFATADHYVLTSPGSPTPDEEIRGMVVEHVMATQTLWQKTPKVMRIRVEGRLPAGKNGLLREFEARQGREMIWVVPPRR